MRVVIASCVVLAVLAGCTDPGPEVVGVARAGGPDTSGPGTTDASGTTDPSPDPPTSSLPGFDVLPADWEGCDEQVGFECATIEVPLDHADPDGPTIPIALIRQPARGDADERIGSVVFNPGGPGGSGLEFLSLAALLIPGEVADRFDLVSFDPRGVGASAHVDCDLVLDDGVALVPDDDRAAWDAARSVTLEELSTCSSEPPGTATRVGTNAAARDLDLIRAAIGDDRLTYVGFSYGTRLGATYAELFPEHVRALVLDGAVAPSTDSELLGSAQADGFDAALMAFAERCDADADCPLRAGGGALAAIDRVRAAVRAAGTLPTDEPDRSLTPGELDLGILSALYSQSAWPFLALAVDEADAGDGTLFQVLADLYLGRELDGSYTNQVEAGSFVNCADDPARPDADRLWEAADAAADRSAYFGELLRASFGCDGLPDVVDPLIIGPAVGAPPILVIGTTGDPATPYEWAVELTELLDSGVLYTVEGEGHTAYTSIDCVEPVVNDYLIDLVVPAPGGSCEDDTDPDSVFLPPGESELDQVIEFFACLAEEGADVPEVSVADVLRDPTGEELLAGIDFGDPATLGAVVACERIIG